MTISAAVDPERLGGWIADRLRADDHVDGAVSVELLAAPASGNSNLTVPFAAHWASDTQDRTTELVLRMQVPTNQIFLDNDVLREFRVLSALQAVSTFPTPATRWAEPDSSVLGEPFFVMERVAGVVPAGTPSIHVTGWLSERAPAERRVAWESALQAMAAIHAVDWRSSVAFLDEGPNGTTLEQRIAHLGQWYEWARAGRAFPVTDAALWFLQSEIPRDDEQVLVWGDARMGNLMFNADNRVAAVLDWELASLGPAGVDLGWWLAMDEFQTTAHGIAPASGYPDRAETIAQYQELTGRTVDNVRWFEVLAAFVLTVTVIRMADIQVASGLLPPDNQMGHGNLTAQMLARWLELPVPDLDPAYAARRGLDTRA